MNLTVGQDGAPLKEPVPEYQPEVVSPPPETQRHTIPDWIVKTCSIKSANLEVEITARLRRELPQAAYSEVGYDLDAIYRRLSLQSWAADPERIARIADERQKIPALFGTSLIHVKEIPNGYCKDWPFPWFRVTCAIGPITIGWRSKVISIDWAESDVKAPALKVFADQDPSFPSKDGHCIHAWSYEAAGEYIKRLLAPWED